MAARRARARSKSTPTTSSVRPIGRYLLGLSLKLCLLLGVLGLAYGAWLDLSVRSQFEGRRWQLPARIYARAAELYVGAGMDAAALVRELDALGYRAAKALSRPGSYHRRGNTLALRTRSFRFWDGEEPARTLELRFDGARISRLEEAGKPLPLARLEPQLIGRVDPRHNEDRVLVRLSEVPKALVGALLAVEDRTFFEHHGVSLRGILRAVLANLRAGAAVQGGSTLSQQLAKNFFLSAERTLWRKLNDVAIAVLLELRYDKTEILEAYLNEIYLGQDGSRAIHGIGLAAGFYFDRRVEELDLAECALLVALVRGPSVYNPRRHPQRALQRRNLVLDTMLETGVIDSAQAAEASARPLGVTTSRPDQDNRQYAFIDLVRRQLSRDYQAEDLRSEGLRVFTTLDPGLQSVSERVVRERLAGIEKARRLPAGKLEAAVVVTDPQSAEVLALVGGRDAQAGEFNRALDAQRQIGSLIKPVVYLAALSAKQGYSLISSIDDAPVELSDGRGGTWRPGNYDGQVHGPVPLVSALARSLNLATVNLGRAVGVENVARLLQDLGLERRVPPFPSLLLGAVEMSPLEVSQVYQSIAAGGFRQPLRAIRSVTTASGEPLKRYDLKVSQVAPAAEVFLLNRALMEVMRSGTASSVGGRLPGAGHLAGKTGTTDDLRDSWFAGYGADRLAVVWVGRDDNTAAGLTGAGGALQLWADIMAGSFPEPLALQAPAGVVFSAVDLQAGLRFEARCAGFGELMPFLEGSDPPQLDCPAPAAAAPARASDAAELRRRREQRVEDAR